MKEALEASGIRVDKVHALPTALGRQLRCAEGRVVVVYNSGAVVAQGKDAEQPRAIPDGLPAKSKPVKISASASRAAAPSMLPTQQQDQMIEEV